MDQAGEPGANAVGCSLVGFISERYGAARVLELVQRFLTRPTVTGLVSWLSQRQETPVALLEQLTHEPWPELVAAWSAELSRRGAEAGPVLERERQDRAALSLDSSEIGGDVAYVLTGPAPASDRE